MEVQQSSTLQKTTSDNQAGSVELINGVTPAQDQYIAFVALGGLIPDPTAETTATKMTAVQLADQLGVERTTMYYWRKSIPDFWERVAAKRQEIGGKDRLSTVWNGIYLKAAQGNPEAAKLYLANFDPNFRMPMERRETNSGTGFADLVAQKLIERARNEHKPKVIDVEPSDSNA